MLLKLNDNHYIDPSTIQEVIFLPSRSCPELVLIYRETDRPEHLIGDEASETWGNIRQSSAFRAMTGTPRE